MRKERQDKKRKKEGRGKEGCNIQNTTKGMKSGYTHAFHYSSFPSIFQPYPEPENTGQIKSNFLLFHTASDL